MIRRGIGVPRVRKLMQGAGLLGSALLLYAAGAAHTPAAASMLVTGATAAVGCAVCGFGMAGGQHRQLFGRIHAGRRHQRRGNLDFHAFF
jgi:hypothetical protein